LAVNVEVGAWNAVAVEVKCEDVRERATLSNGTAMVKGIPTDEDCTLYFKGGMPVQFHPVRGGQSLTCTFEGATASCK